jgi:hypothetical protein
VSTAGRVNRFIVNLAYEGVPQRAIARALGLPANEVEEVVAGAVGRGIIVAPSGSDWPPGSQAHRHPCFAWPPIDDSMLLAAAAWSFTLTCTQATIFLALVRQKFCTKESLRRAIESRRRTHTASTDCKIVDVMISMIRKKLRGRCTIQTARADGYFIPDTDRRIAAEQLLGGCFDIKVDDAAVKRFIGASELPVAHQGRSAAAPPAAAFSTPI